MNKEQSLDKLRNHIYYGKLYSKLNMKDKAEVVAFALVNFDLDKNDFEFKVNRMFLDMPDKPKNWTLICELLSAFNGLRFSKGDK